MPYTRILPKPLLPIGDRPVLEIIVEQLRDAGVTDIVMATGYLSGLIESFFGDGSAYGVRVSYLREPHRLGTAGPLASVEGLDDTFLVVNGDVLTSPLFLDLLAAHRASGACATLGTYDQDVEIDYGVIEFDQRCGPRQRVVGIDEKPRRNVPVYIGIGAFEPATLALLTPGDYADVPDWVARITKADMPVAAYQHSGYWADVGTVHDLERAVSDFERGAERFVGRGAEATHANGNGTATNGHVRGPAGALGHANPELRARFEALAKERGKG